MSKEYLEFMDKYGRVKDEKKIKDKDKVKEKSNLDKINEKGNSNFK